ncbi:MAG TPA: DUF167 domain-containing protein [Candidatus Nanoarchaeia archaeon]|nr:DUF167 domain-containing protein [Candidatus Nanoarchaeia archaeon]
MNQPVNLTPFIQNGRLPLKIVPNAKKTLLKEENGTLKLYLHAPPEKDKANKELMAFFKKEYGLAVQIVSGMKSREKVVEIH